MTGTTAAATLTVTGAGSSSAYIFTVGDVVRNYRTGENFLVATIGSATTITLAAAGRAFGTTAAATMLAQDALYIIGNASEENASARNINTTRSTEESNYTQIFKTTIGVSETEKNSALYGEADLPYQRKKKALEHALDIERAFWFGEKKSTTGTNGHPKRATGGVHEFIVSNNAYVQDQGGPITAPDFNAFLREGFNYGSTTKYLFSGGIVVQAISEISRGQLQTKNMDTSYGVKISEWVTPFGTVKVVNNPLFVQDYAGDGYLLDLECFRYRYMANRDTKLYTNVQAPDVDGEIDQFITECGLERKQAAKCALLKNCTD